jgi:transposase
MVTLGVDAHKRSHTIVAADEQGRQLGQLTVTATSAGHLRGLGWARQWPDRCWAVEDCRQLSRRLGRDLLAAGEQLVRVPPKLMAGARRGARTGASPTRSTPWRWLGRCCASRACQWPTWTGWSGRSGC